MNTWYLIMFDCPCILKIISSRSKYKFRTPLQFACLIFLHCHVKNPFTKMQQRRPGVYRSERLSRTLLKNLGFKADSLLLICGCYYSFPNTVFGLSISLIGLMFQISKICTQVWRLLREKMHSIIDQFGQLQDWVSTHSNWISLPTSIIRVPFFSKKSGTFSAFVESLGCPCSPC